MICIRVKNEEDDILVDTFSQKYYSLTEEEIGKNSRYYNEKCEFGFLEIYIKDESRLINSNKNYNVLVSTTKELIRILLEGLSKDAGDIIDEHLHNIIKIHGNQKSIIERCTYSGVHHESYGEFVKFVESNLLASPNQFAHDLCELSKEINFMDYHIGGYRLMSDKKMKKTVSFQGLKKFLLGLSYSFFDEFNKNKILLNLHDVDEKVFCEFEYETFNIAMHCFLQNAAKYAMPGSKIHVRTNDTKRQIIFSMTSVKIEKNEMGKIFEKGVYGVNAPQVLRGDGIGMFTLKKALERSGIDIYIDADYANNQNDGTVEYVKNSFELTFPNGKYEVRD